MEEVKFSCQCCPTGTATHVYEMFTVKASILFCNEHLSFFKQCSGEIRPVVGKELASELTKAESKEVAKLIASASAKT